MIKKILFALTAAACLYVPAKANTDWNAPVKQIILCNDSWFEFELSGKTMPFNGSTLTVRFIVKSSNVGVDKFKQTYAMALTAFATQANLWVGTTAANSTTSTGSGNCNSNNVPAQNVFATAMYR
jgi:hypothetical protein